ncbi:hypothetical protein BZY95_03330 [Billgrantia desiderata SP1]|nr:hypothetical protein BZY95_03330 [Halomonas desiderata SP1]
MVFRKSWTSGVSKIFTVMVVISSSLSLCPALRQGECKAINRAALMSALLGVEEILALAASPNQYRMGTPPYP